MVWEDEKVLEVDNGDGGLTMWMYLMRLNCTFLNGWNSRFCVVNILSQFKKSNMSQQSCQGTFCGSSMLAESVGALFYRSRNLHSDSDH